MFSLPYDYTVAVGKFSGESVIRITSHTRVRQKTAYHLLSYKWILSHKDYNLCNKFFIVSISSIKFIPKHFLPASFIDAPI